MTEQQMKNKLAKLISTANKTANSRGHLLRVFQNLGKYTFLAICKECTMEVVICANPAPNDVEIGGEAVALNCR